MSKKDIRITGFGGQGVVLSGYIIGRASGDPRRAQRHDDSEFRPRSSGFGLQRHSHRLGRTGPLPLCGSPGHIRCHVGGRV